MIEFSWTAIDDLYRKGLAQGRQGVIGCLVVQANGRIFAQRRALTRRTFPGCWDLVGGHIEAGETPREALVRELAEETGWTLNRVEALRKVVDWESGEPNPQPKREFVLVITIKDETMPPRLEADKVSEGRWFGPDDLEGLNENRDGKDRYVYDLFREEFATRSCLSGG